MVIILLTAVLASCINNRMSNKFAFVNAAGRRGVVGKRVNNN